MSTVPWLDAARRYIGVKEQSGPHHNPKILQFVDQADGSLDGKPLQGIRDDETPWCASFVCAVLEESGIKSTRSAWARSFRNWGAQLHGPAVGAIVVFERGPTSGHVGFVEGKSGANLIVLGGNQGDMVRLSPFSTGRVLSYRWPLGHPIPQTGFATLPAVSADGQLSTNEG
jgi:uncharacterized protein (TIGR02594 family)